MIKKNEEIPIREEAKTKLVIFYVEKLEPGIKEAIRLMENEIAEIFPLIPESVRMDMANDIIFSQLGMRK